MNMREKMARALFAASNNETFDSDAAPLWLKGRYLT